MGIKIAATCSALLFVSTLAAPAGITQSVHHNAGPAGAYVAPSALPFVAPTSPSASELRLRDSLLAQNLVGAVQKYTDDSGIMVVYPRGDKVPASSTYIAGAVPPGSTLTCNGDPVRLSAEGFFAHVVSLKPGTNIATLQMQPGGRSREVKIEREVPAPPVPAGGCKIDQSTCVPKVAKGIVSGDMIEFSVRATPGQEVTASIGKRRIVLHAPASTASKRRHKGKTTTRAGSPVNHGLDAAYGKMYQRSAASPGDLYVGSYKVQPDDRWNGLPVKYTLRTESKSTSATSPGKLSTLAQPIFAETAHDKTIVRTGPGQGRITPLPAGVRLLIDGWYDDSMRCVYAPNHHYWIKKDDLFENQGQQSDTPPDSVARTINVGADDYGATITVPLSQKLPFSIEQQTKPSRLNLRIYGVTADTDWVTPPNSDEQQLVDSVTWKQGGDGIYEVSALLKHNAQWGFKAEYHDTNLVLHIKGPPHLSKGFNHIEGLKICVDPGHGGTESGAIGCSGVREAEINLAIALKLKRLLEQEGAIVTMTRISDKDVSLEDRVAIAEAANADVLLSVHNNALPDGRDPWAEHGTSTYWYHPQSINLAHQLKDDMVKKVGFPDFGSRFQNLALTRPSSMLATLVEVGFVIDPPEYAQLISNAGQQKAAQGIIDGLANYLIKSREFGGYGSGPGPAAHRGKQ